MNTEKDNENNLRLCNSKKFFLLGVLLGAITMSVGVGLILQYLDEPIYVTPNFSESAFWPAIQDKFNELEIELADNIDDKAIHNALSKKGLIFSSVKSTSSGVYSRDLEIRISKDGKTNYEKKRYYNNLCDTDHYKGGPLKEVALITEKESFIITYPKRHAEKGLRNISEVRDCAASLLIDGLSEIAAQEKKIEEEIKQKEMRKINAKSFNY
tara:strand:- start:1806 stop:2441 length:636 start_codon:yes stop_codon:yes gene_type:complete